MCLNPEDEKHTLSVTSAARSCLFATPWTASPTPGVYSDFGDAIQPSHPLLSPSPPAFNLFQHQGLFQ